MANRQVSTGADAPDTAMESVSDIAAQVREYFASGLPTDAPVPQEAAQASPVEARSGGRMEWAQDSQTGAWRQIEVRTGDGSITVSDMLEPNDKVHHPLDLGALWEDGRGRDMHYWWASDNPTFQTMERMNHYGPVKPSDVPELRARFAVVKDPQFGEVYKHGDTILMEVPRALYEARRAREDQERKRDSDERRDERIATIDDQARNYGAEVHKVSGETKFESTGVFGREGMSSDVEAEASSAVEAILARHDDRGSGRRQFSGFGAGPRPNYGYQPPA